MSFLARLRIWLGRRAQHQSEMRHREMRRQLYPDFYITSLEHRRVFNAAPVISPQTFDVDDNAANASEVADVKATDPDPGDVLSFAITAGNTGGTFSIDPATGKLSVADDSELGSETSFALTIEVTDPLGASDSATITINVNPSAGNARPTINDQQFVIPLSSSNGAVVGTVLATDADPSDSITYSITGGDASGTFAIDPNTGEITVADDTQLTTAETRSLTIRVEDDDAEFDTATVEIQLNAAPTDLDLSGDTVSENDAGAVVGSLSVTDANVDDQFTVVVDDVRFEVVGGQLKLKDGVALDYETDATVPVIVTVTDKGGATYDEQFTINVTDENEAPTAIGLNNQSVLENSPAAVVGNVTVTDEDTSPPFNTQSLQVFEDYGSGFVASTRFEVVGGQLRLKAGVSLNHEAEPTTIVRIRATDGGGETFQDDFTITVTDANEAVTDIALSASVVAENAAGAIVGTVTANDPDNPAEPFGTLTYVVQEDYGSGFVTSTRFEIVGGQLKLKAGTSLDHETEPTVTVRIRATDGGGQSYSEDFAITVTNVNEGSSDISLASTVVAENATGAVVGTVTANDPDDPGSLTFEVEEDYGSGFVTSTRFEVVGGQLRLQAGVSLNHEAEPTVTVRIRATDGGGESYSEDFAITVTDVNEAVTDIGLSASVVAENVVGAVVGTVTANDPDNPAEAFGTLSFEVQEDYGSGFVTSTRFEIVGGQLKLKAGTSLNHEVEPSVTVRIRATDGGGETYNENFAITVTDANEAVTDLALSSAVVAENSAGAVVGTVTANDPDNPAESFGTLTYAALEDYGSGFVTSTRFEVVGGQLRLKAGVSLNHEVEPTVTVRIRATDGGGESYSEDFAITVTDVNEVATDIALSSSIVAENVAGAVVGTVTANDPDNPAEVFGTLTFEVEEDYGSGFVTSTRFEIVGGQLKLKAGVSLDHETEPTVTVRIRATDGGGLAFAEDFELDVDNTNEPPTDIALGNQAVNENSAGAVIGSVTVTDIDDPDDPFGTHTFVVEEDYGGGFVTSTRFEVVGGQLRLKAGVSLNHEAEPTAVVRIRATDGGGLSHEEDFTIDVDDVNETPSDIALSNQDVTENDPGAVIGTISVTDPDDSTEPFGMTSLVVQEDYGSGFVTSTRFEIVGGQLKLKAGVSLNHEAEPTVVVRVRATDGGGLSRQENFTLNVTDVNEPPTDIVLGDNQVNEDEAGATVGSVSVSDVDDPGEPFGTHSIVVEEDYGGGFVTSTRFEVVGGQLRLKAGVSLDHETEPTVTVRIRATDGGGLSHEEDFVINVVNVNEDPVATNNAYDTTEDAVASGNVILDNTGAGIDSDVENDVLTVSAVNGNAASVGQTITLASGAELTVAADGSFTYDPTTSALFQALPTGSLFVETFRYRVSDGNGGTDVATVTLRISGANDNPLVNPNAAASGTEDTVRSFTHAELIALLGAVDVDDSATDLVIVITDVQNATYVAGDSGGNPYTFTPTPDFNGNVTFTYQLQDDENFVSALGTGTITLAPVNDAPSLNFGALVVNEDSNTQLLLPLVSGFADVETTATSATFEVLSSSAHVTASINNATDRLTITATTLNYNGPASIVIRVTDLGDGISAPLSVTQTVAVTVVQVNDAPTAVNDSKTLPEDPFGGVVGSLLDNDFDVDNNAGLNQGGPTNTIAPNGVDADPSMVMNPDSSFLLAHGGTLHLNPDGTYLYQPAANFNGTETFLYRVRDTFGATSVGTLTLNVTPVNDAPLFDVPLIFDLDPANPAPALVMNVVPGPLNEAAQQVTISASWVNPGILPEPSVSLHPTLPNTWQIVFDNPPFENQELVLTIVAVDDGGLPAADRLEQDMIVRIIVSQIPVNTAPVTFDAPPEFAPFVAAPIYWNPTSAPPLPPAPPLIAAASAESSTQGERAVEVYLAPADGSEELGDAPILVLPPELLNDLKRLFRELPDDRYRIYLRLEDGTRKQVLDVYVRDGRPFDPDESSEELVIPVPEEAVPAEVDEAVDDVGPELPLDAPSAPEARTSSPSEHTPNIPSEPPTARWSGFATAGAGLVLLSRSEHRQRVQRALSAYADRARRRALRPGDRED